MKSKLTVAFLFLLSFFSFWASPVRAESIPDKPPLSGVYDPHGYLSKKVVEKVATFNWEYSKTKLQPQIAVVVVDTVDDDIETVARETARSWHVGFSDTNYGTLVLISIKDRKIRTETSNNMGTIIPDAEAAELNDLVKSDFRKENYSEGVLTYLSAFKSKIDDYIKNNQSGKKKNGIKIDNMAKKIQDDGFIIVGILFSIVFLLFYMACILISDSIEKKKQLKERCQFDYDGEEGLIPAPSMIGENYQFTGRTETTEDRTVQTHIYKLVEHEVPGDAPKREPEEIQITLHVDEETGEELVEYDPGLASPKEIEHYTYTGKTTQEEGIRTHFYKKVITEVPSDAPSVEIPELKATRYQTEDGTDVKDSKTGFVDAPNMIGNYQFTGVTNTNESGDVQTHIYKLIETEVPSNAPQVVIPELRLTRHVNKKGEELLPIEEGSNGPRKTIGDYEYTGRTDVEGGVTTHVYAPIRYEIPSDAPQYNIPELKVTRHVDEKDKELIETEKGIQPPRKTIDDHEYTGHTAEKDGITTHVYTPIKHEVPSDAPKYDIPELKVTRHVDEKDKDKELIETEKGIQPPRKTIGEHEYTGLTTEKDGITTHIYKSIKHEVPGDAPIVDIPELKATRYVNEKGEEIKESEAGFIDAPKTIGDYEFTGKTELNDGKDVQTHIYKLVEKPVMPTPDPKKPETRQPEAPKSIETPKSNDSIVVESAEQPQFVKNELPKTGETNSNLALVGVSVLTSLGSIGFIKRKREE